MLYKIIVYDVDVCWSVPVPLAAVRHTSRAHNPATPQSSAGHTAKQHNSNTSQQHTAKPRNSRTANQHNSKTAQHTELTLPCTMPIARQASSRFTPASMPLLKAITNSADLRGVLRKRMHTRMECVTCACGVCHACVPRVSYVHAVCHNKVCRMRGCLITYRPKNTLSRPCHDSNVTRTHPLAPPGCKSCVITCVRSQVSGIRTLDLLWVAQ